MVDYATGAFTAGLDYYTSDFNDIYSITLGYDLGNGMDVKARIDSDTDTTGASDFTTDTTTIAFGYEMSSNVALRLENYARKDDGTTDYSNTTLSFIANF
jgi:hypothetical protein